MNSPVRSTAAGIALLTAVLLCAPARAGAPPAGAPVPALSVAEDERLWGANSDRAALLRAIDASLRYVRSDAAVRAYARQQGRTGITRERAQRSLVRLRELVKYSRAPAQFDAALAREFVAYEPPGAAAHFTGYFEPVYEASRVRTASFRYPVYRRPARLPSPAPTREQLEGRTGIPGSGSLLRGKEIAFLRDRFEAYLAQVQGSARLRFPDGRRVKIHNDGHNGHLYTSMGRQLVADGEIPEEELTLPVVMEWFRAHPEKMDEYLPRNRRFVFFREARDDGRPPTGSTGAPLVAERSIATDKRVHPPGAPVVLSIDFVNPRAAAVFGRPSLTRLVLDHDTGSAIVGPGRVDVYMGSGPRAGERAGVINSPGRVRYLLLRR